MSVRRSSLFLVDTREQNPWPLAGRRRAKRALRYGDYTVKGLENLLSVERKSGQDFVSSLIEGRLQEQCERASRDDVKLVVVVEDTFATCEMYLHDYSPSRSLPQVLSDLVVRMGRVPIFAGDRGAAERVAVEILEKAARFMGR